MNPVRNNEQNMGNSTSHNYRLSSISNGMKKLLMLIFLIASMTGVAHAQVTDCSVQSVGTPCVDATSGASGTCQPTYDLSSMTCKATGAPPAASQTSTQPQQPSEVQSGFTALAPIPGLTDQSATSVMNATTLANFFNNLYKYLIGLAAILAVIEIIWGGLEISTKDSVSKQSDGRERITQAIFGLVLVLSPVLVFSIINPNILNLSLNLPVLNTTNAVSNITSSSGTPTIDSQTQCSVTGTAGVLQFATCPSGTAAQAWGQQNCTAGGILSTITPITKNPDGTIATCRVSCTRSNVFEFIDTHTGAALPPNQIMPLAVASNSRINGTDTIYETNGSDAVQYANICHSIGFETCISGLPSSPITLSHACSPLPSTPLPATAPSPAKCYTETLSCEDASLANVYCVSSPDWTPFQ